MLCAECGFDWDSDANGVRAEIPISVARAAALASGASLDGVRARPEPAVWSALEYVVHLRAALGFYADRIRRTLAEDRPRLTAYGFGAACERDDYNGEEPNTAIAGLRSAANAVSDLLDGLTPALWDRVAIGSEGDERTVLALARRAAHETRHHAGDVRRSLATPRLVMITGASPGLGKSTLSKRLAGACGAELLEEAAVLQRAEFAPVIASIRATRTASAAVLLDAAAQYLATVRTANSVVVDAVFPYFPSQLTAGYNDDALLALRAALAEGLAGFDPVQLHLTGDARAALTRAVAREGAGWLDQVIAAAGGREAGFDDVVRYLEASARRARRLQTGSPWPVHELDADAGPDALLHHARGRA
ncbi:MAG: DinB family protein [Acidimicrobiia bacterium]